MAIVNEAQLLFASVLAASVYLVFRVLEAGLMGSLSAKFFAWAGRTDERKKLELALTSEKATLHFKPPSMEGEAKAKFLEQLDKVPIDEATGEAIIEGKEYLAWLVETRKALQERACEAILVYRNTDIYFRNTFCKMSQGLGSMRSWKEAEEARQNCEVEFQDIAEWASKLKSGWNQKIFKECSTIVDDKHARQMHEQQREEMRLRQVEEEKLRVAAMARMQAAEERHKDKSASLTDGASEEDDSKRIEELAKAAQDELLNEEEDTKKAATKKTKGSRKN